MADLAGIIEYLRGAADRLEALSSGGAATAVSLDGLASLERAAVAEEVASIVRHDLRNHLGSVRNAAFYLRRRSQGSEVWRADPRVPRFFELIDEEVLAATSLLDDRLDLKRLFGARITRVAGADCVAQAVAFVRTPSAAKIEVDALSGEIEVDAPEVSLAVRCLVENAVEASPDGRVIVLARASGRLFVITVTDDGTGFLAADRERIFEPFHTTKPGHAGLGLNIARRVAHRYGGSLTVEPGAVGVIAELSLPLVAGPQTPGAGRASEAPGEP